MSTVAESAAVERGAMVGENITRLVPYSPGKPIEEVKRELGLTDVIKLASNENSLGPSPLAVEAMRAAAERVHLYPDAGCQLLREAVAAHLSGPLAPNNGGTVPAEWLVFGNGSDEIIHYLGITFLQPGDEVIQAHPSFMRYESAAVLNHAACHLVPLRDWTHDLDEMADRIDSRTRLIFIANPNNPTGTSVTAGEVEGFLDRMPERAVVVFDEAYFEYVTRADYPDTLRYISEGRNVVVLRTFSKLYGLAGLRVGYGIMRPEIAGYLNQVREPFNVSLVAQEAARCALTDADHVRRTLEMNERGKAQLYAGFTDLGLRFTPTDANFVWVDLGRPSRPVFEALLRRGVIVRTGDVFGAPNHLRVTIGTAQENARFLAALADALNSQVPPLSGARGRVA